MPHTPIETRGLARGTIQRVRQKHLKDLAEQTLQAVPALLTTDPEPPATKEVSDDRILAFLIEQGLRPGAADELTTAFRRVRLLANYYYRQRSWHDVREHETRSFLILPLLLALGWAEQQVKIELPVGRRRRADLACFLRPYDPHRPAKETDEDCVLILESKGFSQGLDYAPEQAMQYAKRFPNCQTIAVSNGYCYKTYRRDEQGASGDKPAAYINLLRPRDRYPLDPKNVDGCLEALRLLMPSSYAK